MPVQQTIALVDDDRNILTSVSMLLEAEGFQIKTYNDGASALEGLNQSPPDLGIFDIKMPRMDGITIDSTSCGAAPNSVVSNTFNASTNQGTLTCKFPNGPASPSISIQVNDGDGGTGSTPDNTILRGELMLDPGRHLCTWKSQIVDLTVTEFLLLKALASRPGHVKNRDQLMDAAYGESIYVDDRTIDSHIKRLRKKFKAVDPEFAEIETLYGVGYRYRDR